MHVFFATPTARGIHCPAFLDALEATVNRCRSRGHTTTWAWRDGCTYVQAGRNDLVRTFMESDADVLLFVDDDVSWTPEDALRLIESQDDVTAGIYPLKSSSEEYPVVVYTDGHDRPIVREDGAVAARSVPTGFMAVKRPVIERMQDAYPAQRFVEIDKWGRPIGENYDLFPQGVRDGRWVGEDYAFCHLWTQIQGQIWVLPDMTLTHWGRGADGQWVPHAGNYHRFLCRQPGGSEWDGVTSRLIPMRDTPAQCEGLRQLIASLPDGIEMAEVGCYAGESTRLFLDSGKIRKLWAVDPWQAYAELGQDAEAMAEAEAAFDARVAGDVFKVKAGSPEAAQCCPASLDFVYLDGSHSKASVVNDLAAWVPRVRHGGWIGGHDYCNSFRGVKEAVAEVLGKPDRVFPDGSWIKQVSHG